jgi:hypothetical protein
MTTHQPSDQGWRIGIQQARITRRPNVVDHGPGRRGPRSRGPGRNNASFHDHQIIV